MLWLNVSSHRPNLQPTKDQLKRSSALMSRFVCLVSTSSVELNIYNWNLGVLTCVLKSSAVKCAKSANDFYRHVTVAVTEQCVKQERGSRLFVDSASAVKLIFTTLSGDKSSQQLLAVFAWNAWNVFPYFSIAVSWENKFCKQAKIWNWHWWATDSKLIMNLDALFSRPEDEMFSFWTQRNLSGLFMSLSNSINCKTDANADVWRWQGQSNKMFTDSPKAVSLSISENISVNLGCVLIKNFFHSPIDIACVLSLDRIN